MIFLDSYIGVPWRETGEDRSGLNCWGLVRLVYREQTGILLPSYEGLYGGTDDAAGITALVSEHRTEWRVVPLPEAAPLDVVLLRDRRSWHVGIVVEAGRMLHVPEDPGFSLVERYDTGSHSRRVDGIFRHASRSSE